MQKQFGIEYKTLRLIAPAFGGVTAILAKMFATFGTLVTLSFFIWFILSIKQYNQDMTLVSKMNVIKRKLPAYLDHLNK